MCLATSLGLQAHCARVFQNETSASALTYIYIYIYIHTHMYIHKYIHCMCIYIYIYIYYGFECMVFMVRIYGGVLKKRLLLGTSGTINIYIYIYIHCIAPREL